MPSAKVDGMADTFCERHNLLFMDECPVCKAEEEHDRQVAILQEKIERLTAELEAYMYEQRRVD